MRAPCRLRRRRRGRDAQGGDPERAGTAGGPDRRQGVPARAHGAPDGVHRPLQDLGARYFDLAEARDFDTAQLWSRDRTEVAPLVQQLKDLWVEGNPYYERVEGIVAGTPSLAVYDVILDAGSSAHEDPASAVPFDLTLPNGKVLQQARQPLQPDGGDLWGTLPALGAGAARADLDGDGNREFGEVLPDAKDRPPGERPTPSSSTPASSTAPRVPGGRRPRTRSPRSS